MCLFFLRHLKLQNIIALRDEFQDFRQLRSEDLMCCKCSNDTDLDIMVACLFRFVVVMLLSLSLGRSPS